VANLSTLSAPHSDTDRHMERDILTMTEDAPKPTIAALVERVKAGDNDAWYALYPQLQRLLCHIARRLGASDMDAEDVAHDTLVAFLKNPGPVIPGAAASYLGRHAYWLRIDRMRVWHRTIEAMGEPVHIDFWESGWNESAPHDADAPEQRVADRDLVERVLLLLTDAERALALCAARGLTHRETADAEGLPRGSMSRWWAGIRRKVDAAGLAA
jgi:RNA polymerase sigma factor (sigma-70 family)